MKALKQKSGLHAQYVDCCRPHHRPVVALALLSAITDLARGTRAGPLDAAGMTGEVHPRRPSSRTSADSEAPTLLVLGGAGTGKTVTAAAAARAHLLRRDARQVRGTERVLFLTFSRTAVTQILDRSRGVLRDVADRVDVLTFHGFAWRLITDYGRYAGYGAAPGCAARPSGNSSRLTRILTYGDLLPAALQIIGTARDRRPHQAPVVAGVCDEFQDTDRPAVAARRDAHGAGPPPAAACRSNQMIYDGCPAGRTGESGCNGSPPRPGAGAGLAAAGSYRDPTQLLPVCCRGCP